MNSCVVMLSQRNSRFIPVRTFICRQHGYFLRICRWFAKMLDILNEYTTKWHLTVIVAKTKIVFFFQKW